MKDVLAQEESIRRVFAEFVWPEQPVGLANNVVVHRRIWLHEFQSLCCPAVEGRHPAPDTPKLVPKCSTYTSWIILHLEWYRFSSRQQYPEGPVLAVLMQGNFLRGSRPCCMNEWMNEEDGKVLPFLPGELAQPPPGQMWPFPLVRPSKARHGGAPKAPTAIARSYFLIGQSMSI